MVDKQQASKGGIKIATTPIAPEVAGDDSRNDDAHDKEERDEPLVLPADDVVAGEIRDVSDTRLTAGLENHPTNVGPDKAVMGAIRIKVGVSVTMMSAVAARPPLDRTLNSTCASESEDVFERTGGVVRTMCP